MKIYLIRHGQTLENAGATLMGREHGVLSDLGKEQATKTGKRLIGENISLIYSSPLKRCLDTSDLVNKSLNLRISQVDLLIERDFGKLTNTKLDDINYDLLDFDTEESKSMGIEPMATIDKRVKDFLQEVWNVHKDDNIAIVTHSNPIRFFLSFFLGKSYKEVLNTYKVKNCSLNVFETNDGLNYKGIVVDDTSHLE
jgi:probable phosphoglycerate mutase